MKHKNARQEFGTQQAGAPARRYRGDICGISGTSGCWDPLCTRGGATGQEKPSNLWHHKNQPPPAHTERSRCETNGIDGPQISDPESGADICGIRAMQGPTLSFLWRKAGSAQRYSSTKRTDCAIAAREDPVGRYATIQRWYNYTVTVIDSSIHSCGLLSLITEKFFPPVLWAMSP